jgi:hypothetical protein
LHKFAVIKLFILIGLLRFAGAATGGVQTFASHTSEADDTELFPIYEHGKVGYINHRGRIVIEPQFDSEGYFRNGLASQTIRPYTPG